MIARLLLLLALLAPWSALAECRGSDLLASMGPERRARIEAAAAAVPFHHGLAWRAVKGDQHILLLGTYHFADPRHDGVMARFGPELDRAGALLVEAGPEEEARLAEALRRDPALIMDAKGPTLPERMAPADWAALWPAMEARGLPAVVTSRLRPWYVSVVLAVSPCMMQAMKATGDSGGLDHRLIARAEGAGVPVRPLEPWDTVLGLFAGMTPKEEIDMIRAAMPAAEYADDYTVTLTEAYFSGESWLIWEFGREDAYESSGLTRAEVDEQMRLAQEKLMDQRNRAWVAPIEAAAAEAGRAGKGVVVGFGALHLPGKNGVLSLLQQRGWTISPADAREAGGEDNGG